MVPLVKKSADTLMDKFREKAESGESIEIMRCILMINLRNLIVHVSSLTEPMEPSHWSQFWRLLLAVWLIYREERLMKWLKQSKQCLMVGEERSYWWLSSLHVSLCVRSAVHHYCSLSLVCSHFAILEATGRLLFDKFYKFCWALESNTPHGAEADWSTESWNC